MKITDIKNFPVRVKLTSGFTLDDSYDEGMIIQLNSVSLDDDEVYETGGRCFKIYTTILPEDVKYNKSVAKRDWLDKDSNPTLDYFEANPQYEKPDGSYQDTIFVMEEDDFCEIVEDVSIKQTLEEVYDLLHYVEQTSVDTLSDENHKRLCRAIYKVKNLI